MGQFFQHSFNHLTSNVIMHPTGFTFSRDDQTPSKTAINFSCRNYETMICDSFNESFGIFAPMVTRRHGWWLIWKRIWVLFFKQQIFSSEFILLYFYFVSLPMQIFWSMPDWFVKFLTTEICNWDQNCFNDRVAALLGISIICSYFFL